MSKTRTNDLQELRRMIAEKNTKVVSSEKEEYQEFWKKNNFIHRKMVAKKNRKWLQSNATPSEFFIMNEENDFGDYPHVKERIVEYFKDEKKRKWILHVITNFLPLNRAKQVPKLPKDRKVCPFTDLHLTDVKNIMVGDRDKHIAFTGYQTTNVLSGIALNELYKFVIDHTYNFDTPEGHIINYALDDLRKKSIV